MHAEPDAHPPPGGVVDIQVWETLLKPTAGAVATPPLGAHVPGVTAGAVTAHMVAPVTAIPPSISEHAPASVAVPAPAPVHAAPAPHASVAPPHEAPCAVHEQPVQSAGVKMSPSNVSTSVGYEAGHPASERASS